MPSLNWIGKEAVINHDKEVPFRLFKKIKSISVGKNSQNLIIHGDNLEALKALMPYYQGKIKCIYIDPPYNTGNQKWVYNDKIDSPVIKKWLGKVVGNESKDLCRHDKWLCMMYPRLKLLRELLRGNGVIFISIDDNEYTNLKLIMDDIFLGNYVGTLKWKRKKQPSFLHGHIAGVMEYILIYAKDISLLEKLSIHKRSDLNTRLDNQINKISNRTFSKGVRVKLPKSIKIIKRGKYRIKTMDVEYLSDVKIIKGRTANLVVVRARFRNDQATIDNFIKSDVLFITKNYGLRRDLLDEEKKKGKAVTDLLLDWGDNQESDKEIKELFPRKKIFDYPKPVRLIKNLIKSIKSEKEIILDSFAGSGTTGHAVLDLNKEDGGNRKFILIELEDKIARNVTTQRIKIAIKKYGYKNGFEYCELGEPLFDEDRQIEEVCTFEQLATYIYFTETNTNLDKKSISRNSIGEYGGTEYYLLFKKRGVNILGKEFLKKINKNNKKKIIYADKCLIDDKTLEKYNIQFKQIPYEVKVY